MKKAKLVVVVGLPGSGKSHLIKSKIYSKWPKYDDYFAKVATGSPIKREPSVTDSFYYQELIEQLLAGQSCLISDVIFCDSLLRHALEIAIKLDAPSAKIEWIYFENNPEVCIRNARKRARPATLAREIKLIKYLSRKYFVPTKAKPKACYSAS